MSSLKRVVAGTPDLVIEDRVTTVDREYRYRAFLRGRTAGGFLTGYGPTEDGAIASLERSYQRELDVVHSARLSLSRAESLKRK